jgi:DNA (cytosine-5)-methyltransferase 1
MPDAPISHGETRQDYETPAEFIEAVERRFGKLTFDLAAKPATAKAAKFFTEADNALETPWPDGLLWLNPPFKDIEPWASQCFYYGGAQRRILMLTPASIDSNWYMKHVHHKAAILAVNPRLRFVGEKHSYPKPLMLSCFGFGVAGMDVWRWKP